MNRVFGVGKRKGPSATNLQAQKSKQIESLRKVGAVEILRDAEYTVCVPQGSSNLTIRITLPPQFPSEKPVLTVQPAVNHAWVDSQMKVVGCPNVNNFSMHSDLGQAIQAVLDEFKRNPPLIVPQHYILGYNSPTIGSAVGPTPPLQPPAPCAPYQNLQSSFPTPSPPQSEPPKLPVMPPPLPPRRVAPVAGDNGPDPNAVFRFSLPNILTEFPALKEMKLHELQELVENDERITEMIQKVPDLVNFTQQRESLSDLCVQLAQANLQRKPEIDNLKAVISEHNQTLEKLKTDFECQSERHMTLSDQYHPANIQTNLKVAVMEADEESEKIAESFLNKEMDIDDFMKSFMEKRTLCHLRRAKEEKLNQIILSQGFRF